MSVPDLQEPLALLEQKDLDAAIDLLEQKVSTLPAHVTAHVLLARAYEAQRRWNQALHSWENAHLLMPNSPVATKGKQRVLQHMDSPKDETARSMVTVEPDDAGSESEAAAEADSPETTEEEASDPKEGSDELAQLRRQAEQEARQGGARPGLTEDPSSGTPAPSSPDEPSSTPEEQIEKLEAEGTAEDLDRLIDELESARIEPDPDAADAPAPDLENDTEDVVSETLARIHENQADYAEAARIYTQLASQEPDRAEEFRQKAAEMREKADADDNAAA